jgi:hypothetical protein
MPYASIKHGGKGGANLYGTSHTKIAVLIRFHAFHPCAMRNSRLNIVERNCQSLLKIHPPFTNIIAFWDKHTHNNMKTPSARCKRRLHVKSWQCFMEIYPTPHTMFLLY